MTNELNNIENLSNKMKKETIIANRNATFLNDNRIRIMAKRIHRFQNILSNIINTQEYEELRNYVAEIFQDIRWDESNLSQADLDINYDYKTFINCIYAILTNNSISYQIDHKQEQYSKIYDSILQRIDSLIIGGND